jgi:hypothetical protein
MPRVLNDITVQAGETREWTSAEGVHFAITNRSVGFKKIRLAFVFSKGRPKRAKAINATENGPVLGTGQVDGGKVS